MIDFKTAIDNKTIGLGKSLSKGQEFEYKYLDTVIQNLETMKDSGTYNRYIYALPTDFVCKFLTGRRIINSNNLELVVDKVTYNTHKNDYLLFVHFLHKSSRWRMWLGTVFDECRFTNMDTNTRNKYFRMVTSTNVDNLIDELRGKKKMYSDWYEQNMRRAGKTITTELQKHPSEMVVSREAIRKSIREIQKDGTEMANVWNSTLTKEEQATLLEWLAKNVYSMRLYVVEGSSWDKAINELYPPEQYGSPRRTKPSELSKDSINGYVSVNDIEGDVPYDILKKITHKKDTKDIIKWNGANKYRINNYLLVLFLLNNYNDIGFKIGVTNLNKSIHL